MPDFDGWGDLSQRVIGGAIALVAAALTGRMAWVRWGRYGTERTRDRAEDNLITTLRQEREAANARADKLYAELETTREERDRAVQAHREMAGTVERLEKQVKELTDKVEALQDLLTHPRGRQPR